MCETHSGWLGGELVEVQISQERSPVTHRAYCDAIVCRGHLGLEIPLTKGIYLVDPLPLCYPTRREALSFIQQARSRSAHEAQFVDQFAEPDLRLKRTTAADDRRWWCTNANASLSRRHKEQAPRAQAMADMSMPQTLGQAQLPGVAFSQPTMPMGSTTANYQPFGGPVLEPQRIQTSREPVDHSMPPPPIPASRLASSAGPQQSVALPPSGHPLCSGLYAPQQLTEDLPPSDAQVVDSNTDGEASSDGDQGEHWSDVEGEGEVEGAFTADAVWAIQAAADAQLSRSGAEEQVLNRDPVGGDWEPPSESDMKAQLELLARHNNFAGESW